MVPEVTHATSAAQQADAALNQAKFFVCAHTKIVL